MSNAGTGAICGYMPLQVDLPAQERFAGAKNHLIIHRKDAKSAKKTDCFTAEARRRREFLAAKYVNNAKLLLVFKIKWFAALACFALFAANYYHISPKK